MSEIVRAKMWAALNRAGVLEQVPPAVWITPWVVHAQPAGDGSRVLAYLARYLFRVAISNSRLEQIDQGHVTFRYRDNRTQQIQRARLSGVEFSPAISSTRPAASLHVGLIAVGRAELIVVVVLETSPIARGGNRPEMTAKLSIAIRASCSAYSA
jgi:hypothetical protein